MFEWESRNIDGHVVSEINMRECMLALLCCACRNAQCIAMEVLRIVNRLIQHPAINADDIGVISMYERQGKQIQEALPHMKGCVRTVDGFQGSERTFMIPSLVRSNARGALGFSKHKPRVRVAFPRANKGMLVFGNAVTIGRWRLLWLEVIYVPVGLHCMGKASCDIDESEV